MEKTWMPTIAGLLNIVSGGLSLFVALGVGLVGLMLDTDIYHILWSTIFLITGILAIVGGFYAPRRKKWGLSLAGSIAALSPILLPGIVSIICIVRSKKEFQFSGVSPDGGQGIYNASQDIYRTR